MKGFSFGLVAMLLFSIVCTISWGANVVKFASCDFEAPYKAEIIRGIGIPFAPLGVVVGFMDVGEEEEK